MPKIFCPFYKKSILISAIISGLNEHSPVQLAALVWNIYMKLQKLSLCNQIWSEVSMKKVAMQFTKMYTLAKLQLTSDDSDFSGILTHNC